MALALSLGPILASAAQASESGVEAVSSPLNIEATLSQVKVLKANGEYKKAASILDALVKEMEPGAARAGLKVMEARFLAWSKDYDNAVKLYREVLSGFPHRADARKGLARTLAWQGHYGESIAEYGKVLSVEPGDTEARLGLARALAWKGDYRASVAQYRKILAEDPSNTEARLELGRTLWWMGKRRESLRQINGVIESDPENSGARSMRHKINLDTGPLLSLDFIVSEDSDSNHLEIYSADAYYSPMPGLKLDLVFSQFEASRMTDRSRARSLGLRVRYKLFRKTTLAGKLAFLSLDTPTNPTSELTGGVSLRQELPAGFRAGAGYSHYALLDTAQLIRNNIRLDEFFAYLSGNVMYLDFTTGIRYGDYSDGNRRKDFFLDVSKSHEYYGILFTLGYRLDYRDFSDDLNNGYFDPADFFAHTIYGRARGSFYGGRIEYDALAGGGVQSFNSTSESTTKLSLQVKGHITDRLTIRGGAKYERSALASASGFKYEEYRAGLDYLF